MTALSALVLWGTILGGDSPLLSYQRMEALKRLLADRVMEVEVQPRPEPGMNPDYVPRITGQGVCIDGGALGTVVLVSEFLAVNPREIRGRTRAHSTWFPLRVVRRLPRLGVLLLQADPSLDSVCSRVPLAPPEAVRNKALVFTVDNPTALPNLFWGFTEGFAEPPLQSFFLSATGLPLSYPLFTTKGELLGLNLRRYTPESRLFLAVTAQQIQQQQISRRGPHRETGRREKRSAMISLEPAISP